MKIAAVPFHIWKSLVEKGGGKLSELPNTWDAFLDFFKPLQAKLRSAGMRNVYSYGYQLTSNGVDPINTFTYETINDGVYRCGFARSQRAYEESFHKLFGALDEIEQRLDHQRYLVAVPGEHDSWLPAIFACGKPRGGHVPVSVGRYLIGKRPGVLAHQLLDRLLEPRR